MTDPANPTRYTGDPVELMLAVMREVAVFLTANPDVLPTLVDAWQQIKTGIEK
jgi:hypothetical protein